MFFFISAIYLHIYSFISVNLVSYYCPYPEGITHDIMANIVDYDNVEIKSISSRAITLISNLGKFELYYPPPR